MSCSTGCAWPSTTAPWSTVSAARSRGRVTVILGGSGSGKTTLLRLVAGLIRPSSGRIEIDGTDVASLSEA
ncbi:MAG: ATP-binding cassette domain-containing protein, partial [Alphaproteobacteria bacterium]